MSVVVKLTDDEANEVREAILETRNPWSSTLDRVTKDINECLTGQATIRATHGPGLDYENDWAGEARTDPSDGNTYVLRAVSGTEEGGTMGYSVHINDIMGGHSRWLALFDWISWEKVS